MVTAAIRATGLPAVRLIAMVEDDRDLRDELRVDVMRLRPAASPPRPAPNSGVSMASCRWAGSCGSIMVLIG